MDADIQKSVVSLFESATRHERTRAQKERMKNGNVISVSFRELCPEIKGTKFSTHRLYSYPGKMIPQIPHFFLKEKQNENGKITVLDPFCGTGTVMVEALHSGCNSIGVEINPIAALAAKVKTTPIPIERLEDGLRLIRQSYEEIEKGEFIPSFFENLHYWFTQRTIEELSKIEACIELIKDNEVRDFFKVVFASIVKDASRADPRIYVPVLPRKGRRKRKCNPWTLFDSRAKEGIRGMEEFLGLTKNPVAHCQVICNDFRTVKTEGQDINMIITSPPYISAQKYVRSTRLEAYWLGQTKENQLDTSEKTIGSERISNVECSKIDYTGIENLDILIEEIHHSDPERAGIVGRYFKDMETAILRMYDILCKKGTCVIVIGENTAKGKQVKTNEFICGICEEAGFSLEKVMCDRILSRGLMTKRNKTAGLIEHEWVLIMRKE